MEGEGEPENAKCHSNDEWLRKTYKSAEEDDGNCVIYKALSKHQVIQQGWSLHICGKKRSHMSHPHKMKTHLLSTPMSTLEDGERGHWVNG